MTCVLHASIVMIRISPNVRTSLFKVYIAVTLRCAYPFNVMNKVQHIHFFLYLSLIPVVTGCAVTPSRNSHTLNESQESTSRNRRFVLAGSQPKTDQPKQAEKVELEGKPKAKQDVAYTTPSEPYRQILFAVIASSVGLVEKQASAKDAAESTVATVSGRIGRLGLTAPPTRLAGRVTSRPGLQDGPATGLGFAPAGRNVFTPQFNPLSGPSGRCQELARAGFFNGSIADCRQSISARRR